MPLRPGPGEPFLLALWRLDLGRLEADASRRRGVDSTPCAPLVRTLQAGEDVVILYGERLVSGPRADHAPARCSTSPSA
jgi:hypothetical protein